MKGRVLKRYECFIELKREDELYINSVLDLRDSLTIDLLGEVRSQGRFTYVDSMTVKDLILMAGGFNYAANKQIEVARLIQYGDRVTNNQVATILKTEVNGDLSFNAGQENFHASTAKEDSLSKILHLIHENQ